MLQETEPIVEKKAVLDNEVISNNSTKIFPSKK